RLADRALQAALGLAAGLEESGNLDRAIEYARRAVSANTLSEEAHRALIRLYNAAGQPALALRQYRELERLLAEELGTQPSGATRALAQKAELQARTGGGPPQRGLVEERQREESSAVSTPPLARAAQSDPSPAAGWPAGTVTFLVAELEVT